MDDNAARIPPENVAAGMDTSKAAGALVLGALAFLIVLRRIFAGALGD